jgi:translation initiation factor IF-3
MVDFDAALARAAEVGLDLVVVAEQADPPVCRLMNFGKFLYEKKRREREHKKKQSTNKQKEVKFHANIDSHDFDIKVNHILAFLNKGYKVKVSLFLRGREIARRETGAEVMQRVQERVQEHCNIEQTPRMNGRNVIMYLAPLSHK